MGYSSERALASTFWPELDESRSRTNLRRVLSDLNQTLGDSWADTQEDRVALRPDVAFWVDINEYRRRISAIRNHGQSPEAVCSDCVTDLAAAVEARSRRLPGRVPLCRIVRHLTSGSSLRGKTWRVQLSSALSYLVDGHRREGDMEGAINYARRLVTFEPWNEAAHRSLMELYHESGRQDAALRQYEEARRILADELDAPPSAETTQLYERIAAHRLAPGVTGRDDGQQAAAHRRQPPAPAQKDNLPAATSAILGREADLVNLGAYCTTKMRA